MQFTTLGYKLATCSLIVHSCNYRPLETCVHTALGCIWFNYICMDTTNVSHYLSNAGQNYSRNNQDRAWNLPCAWTFFYRVVLQTIDQYMYELLSSPLWSVSEHSKRRTLHTGLGGNTFLQLYQYLYMASTHEDPAR